MKTVVLSLGGSLIVPDKVDTAFLKNFKKIVEKYVKKNYRFVIMCGGGKTARNYQESLRSIIGNQQEALDWIGTYSTWLNAQFIKTIFKNNSENEIVVDP